MTVSGLLAISLALLCAAEAWRRTAWFSPATLWSLWAAMNLVVLYGVIAAGVHLPLLQLSPMPSLHLAEQASETALFFALMALIGPLSTLGLSRRKDGGASSGEASSGGASSGGTEALRAALGRLYDSPAAGAYAVFAALAAGLHFALIDKQALVLNTEYLSLADPRANGLDGAFGTFLNNALRPLAMPAFLLAAVRGASGDRRRRWDARGALIALICAYAFAYSLAIYSRYLMVYLFVFFLGKVLTRQGFGLRAALTTTLYTALIVAAFAVAIAGRGFQIQGLASIGAVLQSMELGAAEFLALKLLVTTFDGGLSFANALRHAPDYEPLYQALSFSPLPSFLDGFAKIEPLMSRRINIYVPMSAFGEAWHFAWPLTALFGLICLAVTRQMTVGFFRHRDMVTIALYPVFLLSLLKFQTYSMRTSLRMFVAIAVISFIACRLRAARERARAGAAGAAGAAAAAGEPA